MNLIGKDIHEQTDHNKDSFLDVDLERRWIENEERFNRLLENERKWNRAARLLVLLFALFGGGLCIYALATFLINHLYRVTEGIR